MRIIWFDDAFYSQATGLLSEAVAYYPDEEQGIKLLGHWKRANIVEAIKIR